MGLGMDVFEAILGGGTPPLRGCRLTESCQSI